MGNYSNTNCVQEVDDQEKTPSFMNGHLH